MDLHIGKAMSAATWTRAVGRLRPFLAFLRERLPLLLVWPALALAAIAVLWGYVLLDLERERRDRQAELAQQVDAYTRSLVIRTRRSIGDTDRVLLLLRHNWAVSGKRLSLEGTIDAGIFSPQYISAVAVLDRNGVVMTSTQPGAVGRYLGDRSYFVEQRRASADRLYLSGPLGGQLSKREVIAFSRRLLSPEGQFAGIVLATRSGSTVHLIHRPSCWRRCRSTVRPAWPRSAVRAGLPTAANA
jgi:hypothetical protein